MQMCFLIFNFTTWYKTMCTADTITEHFNKNEEKQGVG